LGQQGCSDLRARRQTAAGSGAVGSAKQDQPIIPVGRITGVYGLKGWVRVFSYTEPRENIVHYQPWYLRCDNEWQARRLAEGNGHGKGVIARLEACEDRDQAVALMNCEIGVRRDQLPATRPGEYYWNDLLGLDVVTLQNEALGKVDHLLETGANDVLVVMGDRERLIPFVLNDIVMHVDLEAGVIRVDWDKEY
jgi:16S rRNA processing protein RimM